MSRRKTYWLVVSLLAMVVVAVVLVFIVKGNTGDSKTKEETANKLVPWDLPIADVPGVLPSKITDWKEEKSGVIWIGTYEGLIRCNPRTNEWRIFTEKDGLVDDPIWAIHIAKDGKVWFGAGSKGVTYYDPKERAFFTLRIEEKGYVSLGQICEDSTGNIWINDRIKEIYYCKSGDIVLTRFNVPFNDDIYKNSNYEILIYIDSQYEMWLMGMDPKDKGYLAIFHLNPNLPGEKKWEKFHISKKRFNLIQLMQEDSRNNIWFFSNNVIIGYYSKEERKWQELTEIAGNDIASSYQDSLGNTWLGCKGEVALFDPKKKKVRTWRKLPDKNKPSINNITQDNQGNIWIVTGKEIYQSNRNFDYLKRISPSVEQGTDSIYSIIPGEGRQVWFQHYYGTYLLFNPDSTPEWQMFAEKNGLPSNFPFSKFFTCAGQDMAIFGENLFFRDTINRELWKTREWYESEAEKRERVGIKELYTDPNIWDPEVYLAHFVDKNKTEWSSTKNGVYKGVWGNPLQQKINAIDTATWGNIHAINESPDGRILFVAEKAVIRYQPIIKETKVIPLPKHINGPIYALCQDKTDRLWMVSPSGLVCYFNNQWTIKNQIQNVSDISFMIDDGRGVLWFFNSNAKNLPQRNYLYRYNTNSNQLKLLKSEVWGEDVSVIPVRFQNKEAVEIGIYEDSSLQVWNKKGVPGRERVIWLENFKNKWLGKISFKEESGSFVMWRARFNGLLKSTKTNAEVYSAEYITDVNVFEKAPDGGVWLGYQWSGLELRDTNGISKKIHLKEGLPDTYILDISQVPGTKKPLAWVGTNDGAALVDGQRVQRVITTESDPGPVDVVVALQDKSAYLAFNPIPADLFLDFPDDPAKLPRQDTYIKKVDINGVMNATKIEVPRGIVLDMALDNDGETVWVGTSAGLYRVSNNTIEKVTANGKLQPASVRILTVDPVGTVWMGTDGTEKENKISIPASVVGYSPSKNEIKTFTPDQGLPEALQIDMLDFTPDGQLAVMANGRLVHGKVFVPAGPLTVKDLLIVFGLILCVGLSSFFIVRHIQHNKERAQQYAPLVETTRQFFETQGKGIKPEDFQTITITTNNHPIPIRCVLGDLLPVEEIQATFKTLPKTKGTPCQESYLVYPKDMDSAASRQLDVYRLRNHTVIIPLSLPFMRSKLANGPDAVREAWDGLLRRYLGQQDLFDMRNALDETRFFFGRKSLIEEVHHALNRREHVALTGPRKIGKSSLLNFLSQRLNTHPIVQLDLQLYNRQEEEWPQKVFKEIINRYDRWGKARFGDQWNPDALTGYTLDGLEFRTALEKRQHLQQLLLKYHQPLVILLDEMERLFPQSEPVQVQRFNLFAGILRALGQEGGERLISLVIADRLPLFNRVNQFPIPGVDTNPFYRFFKECFLKSLEPAENDEMITEIGHAMGLTVEAEVLSDIYRDSGGFPALARQLASATACQRGESSVLQRSHYQTGLIVMEEEQGEIHRFFKENFWNAMNPTEHHILSLAATEAGIPSETFETTHTNREEIMEARRDMLAVGILEKVNGNYRVCGALFRQWIKEKMA